MYSQAPITSSKKRGRNADDESAAAAAAAPGDLMVCGPSGDNAGRKNWNFVASSLSPPPSGMPVTVASTTATATTTSSVGSSASTIITGNGSNPASKLSQQQQQISKQISNSKQSQSKKKSSNKSKEDMLSRLGLLPSMAKIRVKSCDPTAGLTLGGIPVTPEKLANLTPMDLDEDMLMRNGEPLPIDELARLLGMDDDFDEGAFELEGGQEEDELILGMIENGMLDLFLQNMSDD